MNNSFSEYVKFYLSSTIVLRENFNELIVSTGSKKDAYDSYEPCSAGLVESILYEAEAKGFTIHQAYAPIYGFDGKLQTGSKGMRLHPTDGFVTICLADFVKTYRNDKGTKGSEYVRLVDIMFGHEVLHSSELCELHEDFKNGIVIGPKNWFEYDIQLGYKLYNDKEGLKYRYTGEMKVVRNTDKPLNLLDEAFDLNQYLDSIVVTRVHDLAYGCSYGWVYRMNMCAERIKRKYKNFSIEPAMLQELINIYEHQMQGDMSNYVYSANMQKAVFVNYLLNTGASMQDKTVYIS
jgi:hypothetical protein